MPIIERQKLIKYKGKDFVDLRDFEVKEAIRQKKTIRVVYCKEYMDLTPKQLKHKTIIDPKPFQSIYYPDQKYYLWSYEWKPEKELSPEEFNKKYIR